MANTEQIQQQTSVRPAQQDACTSKNVQEKANLIWAIYDKLKPSAEIFQQLKELEQQESELMEKLLH